MQAIFWHSNSGFVHLKPREKLIKKENASGYSAIGRK